DEVLPRVPVGKQEFKYWKYDLAQGFTVPETLVGRKSKPNEVEFSATDETSSTEDHGLDAPVPQADIDNAPTNYNPLGHATEQTTNLILLDREARTSK
ncbi:TPA: phage capsid protein, partial [Pseudomonas aeruginosa]|nr:phage capsid protein [Pseudomonas aeruginosa]